MHPVYAFLLHNHAIEVKLFLLCIFAPEKKMNSDRYGGQGEPEKGKYKKREGKLRQKYAGAKMRHSLSTFACVFKQFNIIAI